MKQTSANCIGNVVKRRESVVAVLLCRAFVVPFASVLLGRALSLRCVSKRPFYRQFLCTDRSSFSRTFILNNGIFSFVFAEIFFVSQWND